MGKFSNSGMSGGQNMFSQRYFVGKGYPRRLMWVSVAQKAVLVKDDFWRKI